MTRNSKDIIFMTSLVKILASHHGRADLHEAARDTVTFLEGVQLAFKHPEYAQALLHIMKRYGNNGGLEYDSPLVNKLPKILPIQEKSSIES